VLHWMRVGGDACVAQILLPSLSISSPPLHMSLCVGDVLMEMCVGGWGVFMYVCVCVHTQASTHYTPHKRTSSLFEVSTNVFSRIVL
jgi:hypothetical protein